MIPKIRVNNLFTIGGWENDDGLFMYFNTNDSVYPDLSFISSDDASALDNDYFIGNSGEKWFSPFAVKWLERLCDANDYPFEELIDGTLPESDKYDLSQLLWGAIAKSIYTRFHAKWKKIWDVLNATYNPINNYDMREERKPDLKVISSSETNGKRWGFNSTSADNPRPTDRNSGSATTTTSGKDVLTRSGNIGVTSSQQLIESELELRKKEFYAIMYKDIDSILCLEIY